MRANSLALRLFFSAATWTVVILVVTGIVLSSLYRGAVERAFDRRLGVYLRTLVADVATPDEASDRSPQSLGEPLFELPLSGWYWQVTRLDHAQGRCALVALAVGFDAAASRRPRGDAERERHPPGLCAGSGGPARCAWSNAPSISATRAAFWWRLPATPSEIDDETRSFDRALLITFAVLGVVLLLITTFQVRFGLAPLNRISQGLRRSARAPPNGSKAASRSRSRRSRARPTRLLDANREIVMRARTHVGNLAHALKTPLSVMMNEAADPSARIRSPPRCASRPTSCAIRSPAISSARGWRRASR